MSRPLGSKNTPTIEPQLELTEAERLDYIANLLIELLEEEIPMQEELLNAAPQ